MVYLTGKDLLGIWDELQFGLLVHRAVADTMGYSVDLTLGFNARAQAALRLLEQAGDDEVSNVHGTTRQLMKADARRRAAVLAAHLELGEDEVRKHFNAAVEAYGGVVRIGTGQRLSDEFSQVITGLERTLTLRQLGVLNSDDPTIDRSATNLDSLGLVHLADELRADAAKVRLFLAVSHQPIRVDAPQGDTSSPRERAHLQLAAGLANVHNGNRDLAIDAARNALELLAGAHYGLFDQMERHFDQIITGWVLGMTSHDADEQLHSLDRTVRLIEEVRGGWQLGSSPSDPTWKPLQRILTYCLRTTCAIQHDTSGWVAMRIMEAMRRRHLAGMLRSVRFEQSDSDRVQRSIVVALTDLVSLAEDQQIHTTSMAGGSELGGAEIHRIELDEDGVVVENDTLPEPAESRLRTELKEAISDYFADAFLPDHVEIDAMKSAVAGWDVLAYTSVGGSEMCRVWVDPTGCATAAIIDLDGCADRAAEFDWLGSGDPTWVVSKYTGGPFRFAGEDPAEVVSSLLIPAQLRDNIAATASRGLVVVPDHWVSRVAWPALIDSSRRELIRSVDLAIVPAVSLLRDPAAPTAPAAPGAATCVDYTGALVHLPLNTAVEEGFLASVGVTPHRTIADLLDELVRSAGERGWAYAACHGVDPTGDKTARGKRVATGLGVELIERDESRVTFLDLLSVPWPPVVTFAGCFTARLNWEVQTGLAPLGLAVSTLARGADTTLGSTDMLADHSAELFVGWTGDQADVGVLGRMIAGAHPVRALADAQRAWLDRGAESSAPVLWARAIAVSQRLPALSPG